MKASKLIKKIEKQVELWGDCEVEIVPVIGDKCFYSHPIRADICCDGVGGPSSGKGCIYALCDMTELASHIAFETKEYIGMDGK